MVKDNELLKPPTYPPDKGHIVSKMSISTTSDNTIIVSTITNSGLTSNMELQEADAREIARRIIAHCDIIKQPE